MEAAVTSRPVQSVSQALFALGGLCECHVRLRSTELVNFIWIWKRAMSLRTEGGSKVNKLVLVIVGVFVGVAPAQADTFYTCRNVGNVILGKNTLTVDGEVFETLETLNDGGVKATHMVDGGRSKWTVALAKNAKGQTIFIFTSSVPNGEGWSPIRMESHECRKQ